MDSVSQMLNFRSEAAVQIHPDAESKDFVYNKPNEHCEGVHELYSSGFYKNRCWQSNGQYLCVCVCVCVCV